MKDRIQYLQSMQQYKPDSIPDNDLKKIRVYHGLSQSELSKITGVTVGTIVQMELGIISPIINGQWKDWILNVSKHFSMLPEDIFPREVCRLSSSIKEEDNFSIDMALEVACNFDYEKHCDISRLWELVENAWNINGKMYRVLRYFFL